MILPEAQRNYDFVQENQRNNLIEQADNLNRKKNQDVEFYHLIKLGTSV